MSKKAETTRIDHDYDELESGSSYIMVVKDTPLIDSGTGVVFENPTELVNVELQGANKQKQNLQRKEEIKRVFY